MPTPRDLDAIRQVAEWLREGFYSDPDGEPIGRRAADMLDELSADVVRLERQIQGWQDLSTAPKDGTPVLIWADGSHLIHLFWKVDHWEWLGGGRCPDGQYRMTHWMPLPAPPAEVPQ